MKRMIEIAGRPVGPGAPCMIVAEVAQAHDGSLGTAHAYIDAVAEAGADAVKFQTHIADAESTPAEAFRVNFSYQDSTRTDYWRRMEFTEAQWEGLAQHAGKLGLIFLSSPFSDEAVDLLARIGVPAWKVASGEIPNLPMLDKMVDTGLPILLSTGMSPMEEVNKTVRHLQRQGADLLVFQSTSAYPCPPKKVGLNMIDVYRRQYGCPVGLSDHSGTIYTGLAAVALGLDMLEVHVTLSSQAFGPDVAASLDLEELERLVDGVRYIEMMMRQPVEKNVVAKELQPMREMFFKSVASSLDLVAGTVVSTPHLRIRKPGTGIPPSQFHALIGRKLARDVVQNQILTEADFV